jgi:cell division ATPase FtsA
MRDGIITGIEVGETRVRLLAARQRNESLRVLAHADAPVTGIERGRITDVSGVASAIQTVVRAAERELGLPLDEAVLCVPASAVLAVHSHGTVEPSGAGRTVTERDGARAIACQPRREDRS